MNESHLLRSYWDCNLDPFNWKSIREDQIASVWRKAVSSYTSPEVEYALQCVGSLAGKRLLLVGCGLGQGCLPLVRMGAEVTGIDISAERIKTARTMLSAYEENERITLCVGDAATLPFKDGAYDVVISQDVLMYSDPGVVLDECARVLVKGGKAVFIESLKGNPFASAFRQRSQDDRTARLTHHLTWRELRSLSALDCIVDKQRCFYLFSVIPFGFLYLWRCVPLYRLTLSILNWCDNRLLAICGSLDRYAWKGVVVHARR